MKKHLIISSLLILFSLAASAEDYQYQYFNSEKDKYVPFSDYIPRVRMHYKTVPHYVEDYYQLYGMKQYYNENSLRMNIARLKTAMQCRFRHPSEALVEIETEQEYYKYRNLLFMHMNLHILRNYLKIASRYDKQHIRFYHAEFAQDIKNSLDIAEKQYKEAIPYWQAAKKYASKASTVKITTDLSHMESQRFSVITGELDYAVIISKHLSKLTQKRAKLDSLLAAQGK